MIMTDVVTPACDPLCDPRKLTRFGDIVRRRFSAHPAVEQIAADGAELFLVKGFLKRGDCRDLVEAINRNAAPSLVYPNQRTRHAGLPVRRGVKHIITNWFGQEPCRWMF
jgi:hypothetical protein